MRMEAPLRLRMHRLRPRLQDEELAALAVLAPLDVHGRLGPALPGVMLFDAQRPLRQAPAPRRR